MGEENPLLDLIKFNNKINTQVSMKSDAETLNRLAELMKINETLGIDTYMNLKYPAKVEHNNLSAELYLISDNSIIYFPESTNRVNVAYINQPNIVEIQESPLKWYDEPEFRRIEPVTHAEEIPPTNNWIKNAYSTSVQDIKTAFEGYKISEK